MPKPPPQSDSPVFTEAKTTSKRRLRERESRLPLEEPLLEESSHSQYTDRMSKHSHGSKGTRPSGLLADWTQADDGDLVVQKKKKSLREKLSRWFSVLKWLPEYDIDNLRNDVVIGMTIGVIVICQTMAHAS